MGRTTRPRPAGTTIRRIHPRRGEQTAEALLSLPQPPTAVFATNHLVAAGVIAAAGRRGIAVPTELSIGSFYDGPVAELLHPSLTAVQFPLEQLGSRAASMLIDLLEGKALKEPGVILSHQQVVQRGSTAPPVPPIPTIF